MHLVCSLPMHMHGRGYCQSSRIPNESLFEDDAARLRVTRECESVESLWPIRSSRSVLVPRPRCILPPSQQKGSSVSGPLEPPCHMSDKKSLQEKTLFMSHPSAISSRRPYQRAVASKDFTQNLRFCYVECCISLEIGL